MGDHEENNDRRVGHHREKACASFVVPGEDNSKELWAHPGEIPDQSNIVGLRSGQLGILAALTLRRGLIILGILAGSGIPWQWAYSSPEYIKLPPLGMFWGSAR